MIRAMYSRRRSLHGSLGITNGRTARPSKRAKPRLRAAQPTGRLPVAPTEYLRPEAEVECYAVQDVRDLVTEAGRTDKFAADIAAYAWDLSYLRNDPVYSTSRCKNGGPLDIYPKSNLWP